MASPTEQHGRALAVAAAKREVDEAERAMYAAADAYSAVGHRVLNKDIILVQNLDEIEALWELLKPAAPPYRLRRVKVRGPLVKQMRETLEARGFEWREGTTYSLPPNIQANIQPAQNAQQAQNVQQA